MKKSIATIVFVGLLLGASISASASPAVTVFYEENGQVELLSSKGTLVLIDVWDPSKLSRPATKNDILLTAHTHPDHGDIDLPALTAEQLAALGKVHLAVMQFDNSYSGITSTAPSPQSRRGLSGAVPAQRSHPSSFVGKS
jgi:hypothetical protein